MALLLHLALVVHNWMALGKTEMVAWECLITFEYWEKSFEKSVLRKNTFDS